MQPLYHLLNLLRDDTRGRGGEEGGSSASLCKRVRMQARGTMYNKYSVEGLHEGLGKNYLVL